MLRASSSSICTPLGLLSRRKKYTQCCRRGRSLYWCLPTPQRERPPSLSESSLLLPQTANFLIMIHTLPPLTNDLQYLQGMKARQLVLKWVQCCRNAIAMALRDNQKVVYTSPLKVIILLASQPDHGLGCAEPPYCLTAYAAVSLCSRVET